MLCEKSSLRIGFITERSVCTVRHVPSMGNQPACLTLMRDIIHQDSVVLHSTAPRKQTSNELLNVPPDQCCLVPSPLSAPHHIQIVRYCVSSILNESDWSIPAYKALTSALPGKCHSSSFSLISTTSFLRELQSTYGKSPSLKIPKIYKNKCISPLWCHETAA